MTMTTVDPYKWLVLVPNVIAGSLFVLGSYASWAVYYRTFSLLIFEPDSITWWALVFFLLVSFFFIHHSLLL